MNSPWVGLFGLAAIFGLGISRWIVYDQRDQLVFLEGNIQDASAYLAEIKTYPTSKEKYYVYDIEAMQVIGDSSYQHVQGSIRLYLRRTDTLKYRPQAGDLIAVRGKPFRIPSPKNPHEFDYAAYMADQNIFFQQFVAPDQIQLIRPKERISLLHEVYRIRQYFESMIKLHIEDKNDQAIALALLIGNKDYLNNDIKQSYAAAGAMHVLAVSGLHVGIIYLLIQWFFKPIKSRIATAYVAPIISILCLWLYALITGFSPSILRAVTMFSVMIFGQSLDRKPNIYNSITFSAFALLITDPNFLFSVGFQLSYLAVLGIVYLYKKFYHLYYFDYWLSDKIWSLMCVSVAAQIATFPISIYYFHQFPTYFLFSNLVVIPAAFLIMALGVSLFVLGQWAVFDFVGIALEFTIRVLNGFVNWIYDMPWSLVDWLYLSELQTILIYASILWIILFFHANKFQYLIVLSITTILISLDGAWKIFAQAKQDRTIIYHLRGSHLMDRITGLSARLTTLSPIKNLVLAKYQVEPNRLSNGLARINDYHLIEKDSYAIGNFGFLRIYSQSRVFHLFGPIQASEILIRLKTEYLIISNNAPISIEQLEDFFEFDHLILDSSNDFQMIRKLSNSAKEKAIDIQIVSEKYVTI